MGPFCSLYVAWLKMHGPKQRKNLSSPLRETPCVSSMVAPCLLSATFAIWGRLCLFNVCVSNCIEHFMGVCKFNTYTSWERCKCCKEKYKNQPRPPHVCTQAERNASWPTNTANTQCRQHLTRPKYVVCHEKTLHHTTLLWPCAICIVHPFPSLLLSSSCRI